MNTNFIELKGFSGFMKLDLKFENYYTLKES